MRGRNTTVVCARVTDAEYIKIAKRAERKGMALGEYLKWLLLRPHKKTYDWPN